MKKWLLSLLAITVLSIQAQTVLFSENFNDSSQVQFTQNDIVGDNNWEVFKPTYEFYEFEDTSAYLRIQGTGDSAVTTTSIESPAVDISNQGKVIVGFTHYYNQPFSEGYALIEAYNGADWIVLDSLTDDVGADDAGYHAMYDVTAYANQNFKVKFTYNYDNNYTFYEWFIEDFEIYKAAANEIEVLSIEDISGFGLTSAETISVTYKNNGAEKAADFDLSYSINGTLQATESILDSIEVDSTRTYTFSKKADLSRKGTFDVVAWVNISDDGNIENDTASISIKNKSGVFPLEEDFEDAHEDWEFTNTFNSSSYGKEGKGPGGLIFTADEIVTIVSPIVGKITNETSLKFDYRYENFGVGDAINVYVSEDYGTSYTLYKKIDANNNTTPADSSWGTDSSSLSAFAGKDLQFKFEYLFIGGDLVFYGLDNVFITAPAGGDTSVVKEVLKDTIITSSIEVKDTVEIERDTTEGVKNETIATRLDTVYNDTLLLDRKDTLVSMATNVDTTFTITKYQTWNYFDIYEVDSIIIDSTTDKQVVVSSYKIDTITTRTRYIDTTVTDSIVNYGDGIIDTFYSDRSITLDSSVYNGNCDSTTIYDTSILSSVGYFDSVYLDTMVLRDSFLTEVITIDTLVTAPDTMVVTDTITDTIITVFNGSLAPIEVSSDTLGMTKTGTSQKTLKTVAIDTTGSEQEVIETTDTIGNNAITTTINCDSLFMDSIGTYDEAIDSFNAYQIVTTYYEIDTTLERTTINDSLIIDTILERVSGTDTISHEIELLNSIISDKISYDTTLVYDTTVVNSDQFLDTTIEVIETISSYFTVECDTAVDTTIITVVIEMEALEALIYPNPLENSALFIQLNEQNVQSLTIVDIHGRVVHQSFDIDGTNRVETNEWNKGLYFVRMETMAGNIITTKVLKQ